jgi:hypothetical protein
VTRSIIWCLRMLKDGEVVRVSRGRYGLPRRPAAPKPAPEPEAPIPPAPAANGHSAGHQAAPPMKPAHIATDPGVALRNQLAQELIEERLGIVEDAPVVDSAARWLSLAYPVVTHSHWLPSRE